MDSSFGPPRLYYISGFVRQGSTTIMRTTLGIEAICVGRCSGITKVFASVLDTHGCCLCFGDVDAGVLYHPGVHQRIVVPPAGFRKVSIDSRSLPACCLPF